jgi:hypothetical protein
MARLQRKSMTRWEDGVARTYVQGDEVPDLKPSGVNGIMLTQEEGGGNKKASGKTARSTAESGAKTGQTKSDPDIIDILEGNADTVKAYIATVERVELLEEILVAEGEGKNRSTVRGAIEDRIKALEEGEDEN